MMRITRRPVPPLPAAWLAAARAAPASERLIDAELAGRELLAAWVGDLIRCDQIRVGRRSTITIMLDELVADWGRWCQHLEHLEDELAATPWPDETAVAA